MKNIILLTLLFTLVLSCIVGTKPTNKRNNEAVNSLRQVYELEMAYKEMFGNYTDNLYALVFIQDTLVTEGGNANYEVSLLEVTDSTFTATAVSVVDSDRDGQFNTWTVNERGIITEIIED